MPTLLSITFILQRRQESHTFSNYA